MPVIDSYLDRVIGENLMKENEKERAEHVSSGKLSAGRLGDPLQWQILKVLGAPTKDFDEYVLRKFKRGNHLEEWYLGQIPGVISRQDPVEYRNVVGFMDALVDSGNWDFPRGELPLEVKSVTNMKFKRILSENVPQRGHCLQACLYALSRGTESFAISYIASDDYRVHTFVERVEDWKPTIDGIIDRFEAQMARKKVPVFAPEETWQAKADYNSYPDWMNLEPSRIEAKMEELSLSFK